MPQIKKGNQSFANFISNKNGVIDKYMKLGDAEVETQRNTLKDQQSSKKAEIEYEYQLALINDKDAEYDNKLNQANGEDL